MPPERKKHAGGRPKKAIDMKLVEGLAHIHCTIDEIAAIMEISDVTLRKDPEFLPTYYKAREGGKMSLRRQQFKAAEGGNTTMLIWLGKQFLGQRDLVRTEVTGQLEVTDLYDVSEEQLAVIAAQGIVTKGNGRRRNGSET